MNSKLKSSEKSPIETEMFYGYAVVRFSRPDLKNPLSVKTLELLNETIDEFDSNNKIHSIIFTGTEKTFAAGANLKEVAGLNKKTAVEFSLRGRNLMQKIYRSEKKTLAAIDGFCMGGALDLAISCKTRIASPDSFFAHPGAKLGIITGWSGTQILPELIGRKNALEMFITAKRIDAFEALRIGLIDEIAADPLNETLERSKK